MFGMTIGETQSARSVVVAGWNVDHVYPRIWQTVRQLSGLWWTLRVKRAHLREPAAAPAPVGQPVDD